MRQHLDVATEEAASATDTHNKAKQDMVLLEAQTADLDMKSRAAKAASVIAKERAEESGVQLRNAELALKELTERGVVW